MRRALLWSLLGFLVAAAGARAAGPPAAWRSAGIGGGGALYAPAFSPFRSGELSVACDMSAQYRTLDGGASWTMTPFTRMQVSRNTGPVQHTSSSSVLYAVDSREDMLRPVRSTNGGLSWQPLPSDPTGGEAWSLAADPTTTTRLLVADYRRLFYSGNSGGSFALKYTAQSGGGLHVGGAFFAAPHVFVGTNEGLLVSGDGGATFTRSTLPGIPAGEGIVSLSGAVSGGRIRLFAVTQAAGGIYGGMLGDDFYGYRGVYTLDWGATGWVRRTTGIAAGAYPFYVATARGNPSIAYLGGGSSDGVPVLYRTTNGGLTWQSVFAPVNNANVRTGWSGWGGDRSWGYGELVFGLAVHPRNPLRAAFTDYGFVHLTDDGGATWRQAYVRPAHENPAGSPTPRGRAYAGSGLENTSSWSVAWSDANTMWVGCSDIRAVRSGDGGATWSFGYSGHPFNSGYQTVVHPATGVLYMAAASVHDLYESTHLTDSRIDGGTGEVLFSADRGQRWQQLGSIGRCVVGVALDPRDPKRLYAAVAHSAAGGIYACADVTAGPAAVWSRLPAPPRTEGHASGITVLPDGTLVATYSGRRAGSPLGFTPSSGVFVSADGGRTWEDRSHPNMRYWTRDLTVDPLDPQQQTWYAGVFSGWGGPANDLGGLYRTVDRGRTWTRLWANSHVSGCTVDPRSRGTLYVTTEHDGLWYTPGALAAQPVFSAVAGYPFRHPGRVFFNPYRPGEIWVTSFGGGLFVGQSG